MGMLRLLELDDFFVEEGSNSTLMRSAFATALILRVPFQIPALNGAGGVISRYPSDGIQFWVQAADEKVFSKTVASPEQEEVPLVSFQ